MEHIRKVLGVSAASHPSDEQDHVKERLDRVEKRLNMRQQAIDIQVDALAADRRDVRSHR